MCNIKSSMDCLRQRLAGVAAILAAANSLRLVTAFSFVPTVRHSLAAPKFDDGTSGGLVKRISSDLSTRSNFYICCMTKEKKGSDPYGDVDYTSQPLEFVDYNDPNYSVDQGLVEGEESLLAQSLDDNAFLEEMREERRKRNDEFQFETYYRDVWGNGLIEYHGEWTTYSTTTFLEGFKDGNEASGVIPGILKGKKTTKVISSASKVLVDPEAKWRGDREVIRHEESIITSEADEPTLRVRRETDTDTGFGRLDDEEDDKTKGDHAAGALESRRTSLNVQYWPNEMRSFDFRGHQGNMCVGNAYTVCDAIKLVENNDNGHDGPFSELRAEVGVHGEDMRLRVKFEYKVKDEENVGASDAPPLHLSSMTVCRERAKEWPSQRRDVALFGSAGANGGLYDPPPVGSDARAAKYMSMDLEGGATILFPYCMEQGGSTSSNKNENDGGWVVSLDWTPGSIRYQVDRKFMGGVKMKGLKTLELSEVQALSADEWRPRNGPVDMRQ